MEKELLTKESILKDVRNTLKTEISAHKGRTWTEDVIFSIGAILSAVIFLITHSALAFLLLLLPVVYYTARLLLESRKTRKLTTADFSVYTDELTVVEERAVYVGGKTKYRNVLFLCFAGGNEWEIPFENYRWSNTFRMSRNGVENTSIQGDSFYLVRLNENGKIAAAYNRKFFHYPEISDGSK